MARRITLMVIALVVFLLGVVAVPLGLHVASQDRSDFTQQTAAEAAAVASVAEEHIDDQATGGPLAQVFAEVRRRGDQVAVYQSAGRAIKGTSPIAAVPADLISSALAGRTSYSSPS